MYPNVNDISMTLILCKNIIAFITGFVFLKFIFKTIWIMFISAITFFLMIQYFLPYMIPDFSQKDVVSVERKINDKFDHMKQKPGTKRIIKKFNKLKDRLNQ